MQQLVLRTKCGDSRGEQMSGDGGDDAAGAARARVIHDQMVCAAERAHDRNDKIEDMLNENSDSHAQSVIRILLALNGGAVVARLAFLGNLVSRTEIRLELVVAISDQLKWFVYGLIGSGVAALLAYMVSFAYTGGLRFMSRTWEHPFVVPTFNSKCWFWFGLTLHVIGVLCAVTAFGFFVCGVFGVQSAIHG